MFAQFAFFVQNPQETTIISWYNIIVKVCDFVPPAEGGGMEINMNIAVIEDSASDRAWLSQRIHKYMADHHFICEIFEYKNAEDFINVLPSKKFSIVFMDIYLEQMTGMEAAILLRKTDKECKLIFLTISTDHILQGYSVNASHYLLKPMNEDKFLEAMDNCNLSPQYDVPYLDLSSSGGPSKLDTSLITHITLQRRTVYIHTLQQVIAVNNAFRRVTEPLQSDKRFLLSIQGVMVNMDYISGQEDTVFILKNGERIPINLRNRKRIQQIYRNYIFENMGGSI